MSEQKSSEQPPISTSKLWMNITIYSLIIFAVISAYKYIERHGYTLRSANGAMGDVALLLIGLSFILSSVSYFWNFADRFIIYRKHLGLVGFAYAVAHMIISLFMLPQVFPFPEYYLRESNIVFFGSAVIAMVIYTIMTAISNNFAIHQLGGKNWRLILRFGYVAYVFSIVHYALRGFPRWINWFTQGETLLPPFGLILTLFALLVIVMRIALWIALLQKPVEPHRG